MPDFSQHADLKLSSLIREGDPSAFGFLKNKFKAALYLCMFLPVFAVGTLD